jgi:LPS-assembly lipoprotein
MVSQVPPAPWCAMRTLRSIPLLLFITMLVTALNGCGWHLHGSQTMEVALPPLYLQIQNASAELRRDLTNALESADIKLVDQTQAELRLTIHNENRGRRVLAVNTSGQVSEYELQYELVFSVSNKAGEILIPKDSILQQRDYQFDNADVLSKSEEESRLFDFMRNQSIQALMRRLRALDTNAPAKAPEQPQPPATTESGSAD